MAVPSHDIQRHATSVDTDTRADRPRALVRNMTETSLRSDPYPSTHSLSFGPSLVAVIGKEKIAFPHVSMKFEALAQAWREDNFGRSVVNYFHPAYLKIIGMGMPVVPCLLREVNNGSRIWYLALEQIAGAPAHRPEMKGDLDALRDAWIEWGTRHECWPI
jgi:hypothetical protein